MNEDELKPQTESTEKTESNTLVSTVSNAAVPAVQIENVNPEKLISEEAKEAAQEEAAQTLGFEVGSNTGFSEFAQAATYSVSIGGPGGASQTEQEASREVTREESHSAEGDASSGEASDGNDETGDTGVVAGGDAGAAVATEQGTAQATVIEPLAVTTESVGAFGIVDAFSTTETLATTTENTSSTSSTGTDNSSSTTSEEEADLSATAEPSGPVFDQALLDSLSAELGMSSETLAGLVTSLSIELTDVEDILNFYPDPADICMNAHTDFAYIANIDDVLTDIFGCT